MSRLPNSEECIIAIDQGTSSLKVVAFDVSGRQVAMVATPTPIQLVGQDCMEAAPERWWSTLVRCLHDLISSPLVQPANIRGVGLCGVMHTMVPVDANGRALGRVALWADQRFRKKPSSGYLAVSDRITDPSANSCVGRVAWLLDNDPSIRSHVRLLLPVKDFLRYKLTGVAATDHYEAAATGLCNQTGREWSTETLETLEIAPHSLPPILQPNNLAGTVSERAADATGLPAGTPVVVGTGDWYAALLGSRAWLPDRASLYLGTAGVLGAFRSQPDFEYLDEAVCFGAVTSTGSAIQWIANILKSQNPKDADSPSGSIGQIAATSEVGALGLIFLPHLMGERGGAIRPHASGTLTGIRLTHQKRDIARAVLEGTAMWLRLVTTDALTTRRIDALIVSGDGARNPLNSVIAAALYQKPVIVPEVVEAGALGVALLTAEGVGLIESRADAASKWIQTKTIVNPDPELVSLYSAVFERFVRTEQMLREQEDFNSQGSV